MEQTEIIMRYIREEKELEGSVTSKAIQIQKHGCIREAIVSGNNPIFVCLPINKSEYTSVNVNGQCLKFLKKPAKSDYNYSTYIMQMNEEGIWECDCQGWRTKQKRGELPEDGVGCTHLMALHMELRRKNL